MRFKKLTVGAVAIMTTSALVISGCGANDKNDNGKGGGSEDTVVAPTIPADQVDSNGTFSLKLVNPKRALIPGNTTENQGHQLIVAMFEPLVNAKKDGTWEFTGSAESIESTDNTNWTIKLKPGRTFHDGTPVNADSYIDAWNYTAAGKNAQTAGGFFASIEGYDAISGENATGDKMSGLKKVDDRTFTVKLTKPFVLFPLTLFYTAYSPLPKAFYKDPTAFGKKPIGNGPFKADSEFVPNQGMTLKRFDEYQGANKAKSAGFTVKIVPDDNTAYTQVQAGQLDVMLDIPESAYGNVRQKFGDRFSQVPRSDITALGFPTYDKRYSDPRVRKAISMAIDRPGIVKGIFKNSRIAADSFASPTVAGYRKGACGEACTYNPEKAKQLLTESGFDTSKPIELWYNSGSSHDGWMQAIGNQIKQNLGVDFQLKTLPQGQILEKEGTKTMPGPFRFAWVADYPNIHTFLAGQYIKSTLPPAGSNYVFYDKPEFDAAIAAGNQAKDTAAATTEYQKAEDILIRDLPAIPIFYGLDQAVFSDRVGEVSSPIAGAYLDLSGVVVKKK